MVELLWLFQMSGFIAKFFAQPKVRQPEVSTKVDQNIVRFYIAVNVAEGMNMLNSHR